MATVIHGTTICDKYKSCKVAYVAYVAIFKFCWPIQKIYLQAFHRFGFHTIREEICHLTQS